jgi:hypothetical protein
VILSALVLNPRCWPQEQVSGVRGQVLGAANQKSEIANQKFADALVIVRRANPYAAAQMKLIGLNQKSEIGNQKSTAPELKLLSLNDSLYTLPFNLFPPPVPSPQTTPHSADQVLLGAYDAVNGALKANATLSGGSTNPTPHNADQVLLASYDPVNGALRINCVVGCPGNAGVLVNGTNLGSSSSLNFQSSAATNGLTLTFTNPSAGNIRLGLSGNYSFSAVGGPLLYHSSVYGMACNDSTDDTSAFNSLLGTVNTAGGGTIYLDGMCLIAGAVVFPTSSGSGSINQMAPIRITGASPAIAQTWGTGALTAAPSGLDLQYNATYGKLETLGSGYLEIDHVTLKDGGSDCAAFVYTTNTMISIHHNIFWGTASGLSACNDAVIFGGTGTSVGNAATSEFQGYGSTVDHNYMHNIRRGGLWQNAANDVYFAFNSCDVGCGSNVTTAITAATNANPVQLTANAHGFVVGSTFNINIVGGTGNWTAINGNFTATVVDANDFTIPVNSSSFGSLSGSPAYYSGAFVDFEGSNPVNQGSMVLSNLVEMPKYPYFAQVTYGQALQFYMNGLWDAGNGYNVGDFKLETNAAPSGAANAPGSLILNGYRSGGQPQQIGLGAPWVATASVWQGSFPGNLTLPLTASSSVGNLVLGSNKVLHAYGTSNLFAGASSGNYSLTGSGNTGLGPAALNGLTSGGNNTGVGYAAGNALTTAVGNALFGQSAGTALTTGGYNAVVGRNALNTGTTAADNTAVGAYALSSATNNNNACLGYYCLELLAGGYDNTAVGFQAGYTSSSSNATTSGSYDTYIGYQAGQGSSTQNTYQTVIGAGATATCNSCVSLGRPTDVVGSPATTYSNLPACSSALAGMEKTITDATVNTWGATLSAGGGSYDVLARCNGTNWTVVGI